MNCFDCGYQMEQVAYEPDQGNDFLVMYECSHCEASCEVVWRGGVDSLIEERG